LALVRLKNSERLFFGDFGYIPAEKSQSAIPESSAAPEAYWRWTNDLTRTRAPCRYPDLQRDHIRRLRDDGRCDVGSIEFVAMTIW
jgi:hypothetical protein